MTESVNPTVRLKTPVELDGSSYPELTIRELTTGELIAFEKQHGKKAGLERDCEYFALVCGVPLAVTKLIRQKDWNRLLTRQAEFMAEGNEDDQTAEAF